MQVSPGSDGAQVGDQAGPPEVDAFVGRIVQQVTNDALLAVDEVTVFERAAGIPGDEFAMSGADQVGLYEVHHVGAAAVHPQLQAVAQHGGLEELGGHFTGDAGRKLQEDVVTGEGHFLPVDVGCED